MITTATPPRRLLSLSPAPLPRPLPTLSSPLSNPRPPPRHLLVLPPLAVLFLLRPLLPGSGFLVPASDFTIVLSLGLRAQYRHSPALSPLSSTPTSPTSPSRLSLFPRLLFSASPLVFLPPLPRLPTSFFGFGGALPPPALPTSCSLSPASLVVSHRNSRTSNPSTWPCRNGTGSSSTLTRPRCSSPLLTLTPSLPFGFGFGTATVGLSTAGLNSFVHSLTLHLASQPPAIPPLPLHPLRSLYTSLHLVRLFPCPPAICPPVPSWPANLGRALLSAPIFSPHPLLSPPSSVPRASTLPLVFLFRSPYPVTVLPTSSAHLPRSQLPAPTCSRPQRFSTPDPALLASLHFPLPLPPPFQSTPSSTSSHSLNRFRWRPSRNGMPSRPACLHGTTGFIPLKALTPRGPP